MRLRLPLSALAVLLAPDADEGSAGAPDAASLPSDVPADEAAPVADVAVTDAPPVVEAAPAPKPPRAPRAPKAKAEPAPELAEPAVVEAAPVPAVAAQPASPEIRNLSNAPFYYDDASPGLADKGLLTSKVRKQLTPKQWARRTPAQWGVLVANGMVDVTNVPAADVAAFDAAVAKEEARLQKTTGISATERAMFGGTPKV